MKQLEAECRASGRGEQFDRLKETLIGRQDRRPYAVLAAELEISEDTARQATGGMLSRLARGDRMSSSRTAKAWNGQPMRPRLQRLRMLSAWELPV